LFLIGLYLILPALQPQTQNIALIPTEAKTISGLLVIFLGFSTLATSEIIEMVLELSENIRSTTKNSEKILEDIQYIRTVARYAGSKMTNISRNQE
jgi:hypothetical protein